MQNTSLMLLSYYILFFCTFFCAFFAPSFASSLHSPELVQEYIQVDVGVHIRVVTRSSAPGLPCLLYQPFAGAWPQLAAGDAYFLPLSDTFSLTTFDPRGVGASTGTFHPKHDKNDVLRVAEYAKSRQVMRHANPSNIVLMCLSSSCPSSIRAMHERPDLFSSMLMVSPVLSHSASMPYLEAEIHRVWGVPPRVQSLLPNLAIATLSLLRLPYYKCHSRMLCSGEFYNPWTYADSEFYDHPFLTYVQASRGMMLMIEDDEPEVMNYTRFARHVHMVWGEFDYGLTPAPVNEEYMRRLHASNTHASFTILRGASHAAHIEKPEEFQEAARSLVHSDRRRVAPVLERLRRSKVYSPRILPFYVQAVFGLCVMGTALMVRMLKPWMARKLVHVGVGLLLVHSDLEDWKIRWAVYAVTVITFAVCTGRMKRYVRFLHQDMRMDPGITTYVATCSVCCAFGIPFVSIAPLFFADPMGAIVGRNVASPRIYGSKTLAGTMAVSGTAFLTLSDPSVANRCVAAFMIGGIELVAGDFDNPCIAAFLLSRAIAV